MNTAVSMPTTNSPSLPEASSLSDVFVQLRTMRLARSVGAHLAITGGMAAGDSLVGQVLGHGLASRLSARLGEGVLNGLLTARVGLSAMAVCRPMPFGSGRNPSVTEVAPFLFGKGAESRKDGDTKKAEP